MRHGAKVDLSTQNLGNVGAMYVDKEYMPFKWDDEELFIRIEKPNKGDLGELAILNSIPLYLIWHLMLGQQKEKEI
eukprot:12997465-Ditylum_brightwellii.AAC.1